MIDLNDERQRRNLLFAANIRYLPQMQPLREGAIDRIVEQVLFSQGNSSISIMDIQSRIAQILGNHIIPIHDLERSLERVAIETSTKIQGLATWRTYKLDEARFRNIEQLQSESERRLDNVINQVFENLVSSVSDYKEPFLFCLGFILSTIVRENANALASIQQRVLDVSLSNTLNIASERFKNIDIEKLSVGLSKFFTSNDPGYAEIQWNISQNYYISIILGLDITGKLLSREIFEKSTFYLDTNVAIAALAATHKHNQGFVALAKACKNLDINLRICQISLDEMDGWITYQKSLFQRGIHNQIPADLISEVHWLFLQLYSEEANNQDDYNFDKLFNTFSSPIKTLTEDYDVELADDNWFDAARSSPAVQKLATEIQQLYFDKRKQVKNLERAIHDALLLLWVQKEANARKDQVLLVTLDSTLPRITLPATLEQTRFTITLDALLQWISPMVGDASVNLSIFFADMIKSRVLPQERFFQPEDFTIFSEMDMQCRNLPADDVAGCIQYYKAQAPNLDPSKPEDREKIAHHVNRFLADPSRKFNQEIDKYQKNLGNAHQEIEKLKKESRDSDLWYNAELNRQTKEIEELRFLEQERQQKETEEAWKKKAKAKINRVFLFTIVIELIIIVLASRFGQGETIPEKIFNSGEIIAIPIPFILVAGIYLFKLTKEDLKLLGWPYTLIIREE